MLTIALPHALDTAGEGRVRRLHAGEGDVLAAGAKLLDFSIDLSAGAAHDCPPVLHYRVLLREGGTLVGLAIASGDPIAPGVPIARLRQAGDAPDALPARFARVTVASILFEVDDWGAAG